MVQLPAYKALQHARKVWNATLVMWAYGVQGLNTCLLEGKLAHTKPSSAMPSMYQRTVYIAPEPACVCPSNAIYTCHWKACVHHIQYSASFDIMPTAASPQWGAKGLAAAKLLWHSSALCVPTAHVPA